MIDPVLVQTLVQMLFRLFECPVDAFEALRIGTSGQPDGPASLFQLSGQLAAPEDARVGEKRLEAPLPDLTLFGSFH